MEKWNAYDKNFNLIEGVTLIRGEPVPEGVYHLVCDVLVRHTDGEYLLMKRDPRKKNYGGMWEGTAGGSALFGETPMECAKRELEEETGICTENMEEVYRSVENGKIYVEFLCITNCDKNSVKLQPGETVGYKWVTQKQLVEMKGEGTITLRTRLFIENLCK